MSLIKFLIKFLSKTFRVAKIGPFNIKINITWFLAAILFTYNFSLFYAHVLEIDKLSLPALSLGFISFLLTFLCVLIHELAHSIVANKYGIPVRDIILFVLGAVANLTKNPEKPKHEFIISAAGPLSNFVIAGLIYIYLVFISSSWPEVLLHPYLLSLAMFILWVNLILAVFNLIPGFPMDGGRILRSILWDCSKDKIKATKTAVSVAKICALGMVLLGIFKLNFWFFLIAFLIWNVGEAELRSLIIAKKLSAAAAKDIMIPTDEDFNAAVHLDVCSPELTLDKVWEIMQNNKTEKVYVLQGNRIAGLITIKGINNFLQK